MTVSLKPLSPNICINHLKFMLTIRKKTKIMSFQKALKDLPNTKSFSISYSMLYIEEAFEKIIINESIFQIKVITIHKYVYTHT